MNNRVEDRLIESIKHQLNGLADKVSRDFCENNFNQELESLKSDPVYEKFSFDRAEYVLIRFMGRISISIGRRLGEIYDKIPRFAAVARFNLSQQQIAPILEGLELDTCLKLDNLSDDDKTHVKEVYKKYIGKDLNTNGIGIEIRYNFNPNDSSRLRKDVRMGQLLVQQNLTPIYLVFSSISPRQDAISRLTTNGWTFLIGNNAINFITELLGVEIQSILDKPEVKEEIKQTVDMIMKSLLESYAFKQILPPVE